jgi:hypothetical protein
MLAPAHSKKKGAGQNRRRHTELAGGATRDRITNSSETRKEPGGPSEGPKSQQRTSQTTCGGRRGSTHGTERIPVPEKNESRQKWGEREGDAAA